MDTSTDNPPCAESVPMTPEQRFFFDLQGWIRIPSVLTAEETDEMKAEVYGGSKNGYEGTLQRLLDHPAIVGILSEILNTVLTWTFPSLEGCPSRHGAARSAKTEGRGGSSSIPGLLRNPSRHHWAVRIAPIR